MTLRVDPARPVLTGTATGRSDIPWFSSMLRGIRGACPQCGKGRVLKGYATMRPACATCSLELEPFRADDAPAYFTIFIVGHLIIPSMLLLEQSLQPETWVHMAIWMPLTLMLTLALLPRIKGAIIGLQWALNVRN
jgi:uncharacterized protein (DUF983 family)